MKKVILLGSAKSTEAYVTELSRIKNVEVVGFLDPDSKQNNSLFDDFFQFIDLLEKASIFIVCREVKRLDFEIVRQMIRFGKHVFVDGFREWSTHEIEEIEKLRFESQVVFQFGNTLYGKPVFTTALNLVKKPRFIKVEKHCQPPKPGTFENWIFTQLSEEFDLVQRLMQSNIRSVSARPMFLFGEDPDLLNIHIEFHNDAICHFSVGRAIDKNIHRIRVYQPETLLSIDLKGNNLEESRMKGDTEQLSLDLDIQTSSMDNIPEMVTLERHVMLYDHRVKDLTNFFENIDKRLTPLSTLDHLMGVADICEVVCEKVKRRYQSL
jgi:predicted dehydrogenase